MGTVTEIPIFYPESKNIEFQLLLKNIVNGKPLHIKRNKRSYVYEKLCELVVEGSFINSKEFWEQIKLVFQSYKGNKPFVYFKDSKFILSDGSSNEDVSFVVDENDELLYEGHPVVINPLMLQKLYIKYQDEHNSGESNEYAHYCISRELEIHQIQIINKSILQGR